MIENLLALINSKYPLQALDAGEYSKMKVSGMNFSISAYQAQGLGHVSTMSAKGFFGMMKMDTLIIVPDKKDLPLYSYDWIVAMGKGKLYNELYNTIVGSFDASALEKVKNQFTGLLDFDPGKHWYDDIKLPQSLFKSSKDLAALEKVATAFLKTFLDIKAEDTTDFDLKHKKSAAYVAGLLNNGGPSTDVFLKKFGKEKTTALFEKVLFGTGLN